MRAFGAANWEPSGRLVAVLPLFYHHLLKLWQKCGGTINPVKPRFYEEHVQKHCGAMRLLQMNIIGPILSVTGNVEIHNST